MRYAIWISTLLGSVIACGAIDSPATTNNASVIHNEIMTAEQATLSAVKWIKQGPVWFWTNFVSYTSIDTNVFDTKNIGVHESTNEWSVSFWPLEGADPDYSQSCPFNVQVIVQKDGNISFPLRDDILHGEMPEEGYRIKNERWLKQQKQK